MTAINGEKGALGSRLLVVVVQVFFTLLEGRAPQVKGKENDFSMLSLGLHFIQSYGSKWLMYFLKLLA